jgi:hypothetical protein
VSTIVDHPADDLAVYAVDALDGPDRAALELHLAGCPLCRHELDTFREALALTLIDVMPPGTVWDAIVAEIGRPSTAAAPPPTTTPVEPADPGDNGPVPVPAPGDRETAAGSARADGSSDVVPLATRRPRHLRGAAPDGARRVLVGALAAAAAVVVAVGVIPRVWDGSDGGGPGSGQLASLPVGAITAPDGTEVAFLRADDDGSYVELTDRAGRVSDQETLQIWDISRRVPVSLGLLGTGEQTEVRVTVPADTTAVAISREEAGGAAMPGVLVGQGEVAAA